MAIALFELLHRAEYSKGVRILGRKHTIMLLVVLKAWNYGYIMAMKYVVYIFFNFLQEREWIMLCMMSKHWWRFWEGGNIIADCQHFICHVQALEGTYMRSGQDVNRNVHLRLSQHALNMDSFVQQSNIQFQNFLLSFGWTPFRTGVAIHVRLVKKDDWRHAPS